MTKWKPLSDPPSRPMPVLLFCPEAVVPDIDMADYSVIIAYYDGDGRWLGQGTCHDIFEVYERHQITHWMPLPPYPPKS